MILWAITAFSNATSFEKIICEQQLCPAMGSTKRSQYPFEGLHLYSIALVQILILHKGHCSFFLKNPTNIGKRVIFCVSWLDVLCTITSSQYYYMNFIINIKNLLSKICLKNREPVRSQTLRNHLEIMKFTSVYLVSSIFWDTRA